MTFLISLLFGRYAVLVLDDVVADLKRSGEPSLLFWRKFFLRYSTQARRLVRTPLWTRDGDENYERNTAGSETHVSNGIK